MKTGGREFLSSRDYPYEAGIPVTLKEHTMLTGYQIYWHDIAWCTGKGMAVCVKDYIKSNSIKTVQDNKQN